MFEPSGFILDAYLDRIGITGPVPATRDTLEIIAQRHPAAIPFENLDPYLRRPVMLDAAALQRKLVDGGRGGWCFEHNLLLGTALTAIGFHPIGLGARVLWNAPPGRTGPRSHMLLLLEIAGHRYIVDAGFGGLTLTAPLRLEPGLEQSTPHGRVRLQPLEHDLVVEAEVAGAWRALYRFDLQPQQLADYEVSNWFLCHHPQSIFLRGVMAARAMRGLRYALRDGELTTHHTGGPSEQRLLTSGRELRDTLEELFGIDVPRGADVDAALTRIATTGVRQAG